MKTNIYSLPDKIQKEEQRRKEHYLSSMQVPKDLFSFVDDWDLLLLKERFEFKRTLDIATANKDDDIEDNASKDTAHDDNKDNVKKTTEMKSRLLPQSALQVINHLLHEQTALARGQETKNFWRLFREPPSTTRKKLNLR